MLQPRACVGLSLRQSRYSPFGCHWLRQEIYEDFCERKYANVRRWLGGAFFLSSSLPEKILLII